MKRHVILSVAALAAVAAWGVWGRSASVYASPGYAADALKGTYGFTEQGGASNTTPLVGVGLLNADGNGAVSGTETVQIYGQGTQVRNFQGSYTINPDGTGTMTLNVPPPSYTPVYDDNGNLASIPPEGQVAKYSLVVVNNKVEFRGIRSENGIFVTASFTRQ